MQRLADTAAVFLFLAATAFVGLHARGWLSDETWSAPRITEPPELTAGTAASAASFRMRVEKALPDLEGMVVAGSQEDRGDMAACLSAERTHLAHLDGIEEDLVAHVDPEDEAVRAALADGLRATRACVACASPQKGCADAARAFTRLESRLGLPRAAGGT